VCAVVGLSSVHASAATVGQPGARACVASSASGNCGPYRYPAITGSDGFNTYVLQDVWNAIRGWSQKLRVISPGNWSVTANMPRKNTAVVSYPDVQELYAAEPLADFSSIYSSFTEHIHQWDRRLGRI
jgi:hypothetical protein